MSGWQAAILAYLLVSALVVWALCRVLALNRRDEPAPRRRRKEVPKKTAT